MGVSIAETINSKPGSARDREIVSADVIVTCPARNFVTLKIVTRSGVTGIGDATLNGRELAVASYLKDHVVYYAGPAKQPKGMASGSFGPTTAGRMDGYVEQFMAAGGSHVTLAKGNRSKAVTDACKKHGGFYLGSIGGPAAILAQDSIRKVEVIDFADLGMEAVWRIEVADFPAFLVVDDKGNDFFA